MSICSYMLHLFKVLVWGKVNKKTANHETNGCNIKKLAWQFSSWHSVSCKPQYGKWLSIQWKVFWNSVRLTLREGRRRKTEGRLAEKRAEIGRWCKCLIYRTLRRATAFCYAVCRFLRCKKRPFARRKTAFYNAEGRHLGARRRLSRMNFAPFSMRIE